MSLADQIQTLEADHAAALASIASLTADNEALKSQNTAVVTENAALVAQADQLVRFTADTRAMVERLSTDALALLRQTRRENYKPPEVVRYGQKDVAAAMAAPYGGSPSIEGDVYAKVAQKIVADAASRSTPEFQATLAEHAEPIPEFLTRDRSYAFGSGPKTPLAAVTM